MGLRLISISTALFLVVSSGTTIADTARVTNGGDSFITGGAVSESIDTAGDAFIAARTADARGTVQGDTHVVGMDVTVTATTAKDLYAMGNTVVLNGPVGEDLTAAGMSVRTESGASVGGNLRIFGNTLTIAGPVTGAVMAAGQDVILNAAVGGDARIVARTISFGPDATVAGTLTYVSREKITVPDRVAPSERVTFERYTGRAAWDEFDDMRKEMPILPTFASMLFGFLISLAFFLIIGALALSFMPKRLESMRQNIVDSPGMTILLGVIGLSMLFGLVPITALTIVGLPFVPIALLGIVLIWTLGYALGAYAVAFHVWSGLTADDRPGTLTRLAVFAAAITFIALLNFIPFVGWVANYTLVLIGIGAMTRRLFNSMIGNPGVALDVDMRPIEDN